jgi:integrase/recombinase XerD
MACIHRRLKSPYWVCEYHAADGRWLKRSTKLKDRRQALKWCLALQDAQDRISGGNASEAQLRGIIAETMEKITPGARVAAPTVREWIEQWLDGKAGASSPNTLVRYRQAVEDFLEFIGPGKASGTLEAVTQRDVIAFRTFLREQGKSAATVNMLVANTVAAPFRQAFAQGFIRHQPVAGLPRLTEKGRTRKQAFTLKQVQRLLVAAEGDWKGAILAGYASGLRLSDVANLRWENIDFANGVIAFHQRKTQSESEDDATVIGLHPDFEEYLKGLKVRALAGPIFPSLAGQKTSGDNGLSMEFSRIMAKAGIESPTIREKQGKGRRVRALTFHSFRHSAATAIFRAKIIEEAQKRITGHSRGQTLKHYTHVDLEAVKQAASMIPRLSQL